MRRLLCRVTITCSSLLLLSSHPGICQSGAQENTATIRLVARRSSPLEIPKTANFVNPYWCQPDGTMVTDFFAAPDRASAASFGFMIAVIGLDGKVKAQISPTQVLAPGKVDAYSLGIIFVNSDEVFVLMREAAPRGVEQKSQNTLQRQFRDREQRFLIERFTPDGTYKSSVQLDLPFSPMQAAAFDSGNFVIAGVDYETRKPRIAIVKQDGQVDRMLDLPGDITVAKQGADESREHGTTAEGITVSAVLSTLIPEGSSILLVRHGDSAPQYRISHSGEVKKIRLPSLKGFERQAVQGTRDGLLVTFTKTVTNGNVETRSLLLDRESLERILTFRFETPPYSALCSLGSEFLVLRNSKAAGFETSVLDKVP